MGKTRILSEEEKNLIIEQYLNGDGLETICKQFKSGKSLIKKVLLDNNTPINKKGNKTKHIGDFTKGNYDNVIFVCKKTGEQFVDVENLSGSITTHLRKIYPDLKIPTYYERKMYLKKHGFFWYEQFFNRNVKEIKQTLMCCECDWVTCDLDNTSGSLTKHLWEKHRLIPEDVLENYTNLWKTLRNNTERTNDLVNDDNHVECEECGERFRTITNSHLLTHNMSMDEYKNKWSNKPVISKTTSNKLSEITVETNKNMKPSFISKNELLIGDFIQSLGFSIVRNDRKIVGKEIDIYVPEKMIGFEYNGLFYHREKYGKGSNYHISKTKICIEKGVKLIHIFSDEWINNQELVKSRIKHILGVSDRKLYARNCEIKQIDTKTKDNFLMENHLQGVDKSSIRYGAYIGEELVGVMTFGHLRKSTGNNRVENTYELIRFCSKNVIGLGGKFIKQFKKDYNPIKIISYADRRWSPVSGDLIYDRLGFKLLSETKPNYWYSYDFHNRESRFKYRKDILVTGGYNPKQTEIEIMNERGFDRIWDCGSFKYGLSF